MDLLFYFACAAFLFFVVSSYLFFSRTAIVRLLQQDFIFPVVAVNVLFFTTLFTSVQFFYVACEPFFLVEPLWQAQLFFLSLCVGSIFLLVRLVLPEVSHALSSVHFQERVIVSGRPEVVFQYCEVVLKTLELETLLQSPESLFLITQLVVEHQKAEQKYVVEIKIEPCFLARSAVHFLCYPAQKGVFVEKKDFKKVVVMIVKPMLLAQKQKFK